MGMRDWLGWLLPALKLQLGWVDRQCQVSNASPPAVTALSIGWHLSRLKSAPPSTLALDAATLTAFGPAHAVTAALPKPAMLNYEVHTLVEVISAPLLAALTVDTGAAGSVAVRERSGGAALCTLHTGGFDPGVSESVGGHQLQQLVEMMTARTPQDIELIQAQAGSVWPFIAAACGKPFEHRTVTRALLDVGLAVLHPLIAQTKHHLNVERPRSVALTTVVPMPGHQSAPSGHSAVAHLLAGLLAPLQPTALQRERTFAAAASIAANRELAGVHFASDSQAGQALGLSVASWLTGLAIGRAPLGATFNLNGGVRPAFAGYAGATAVTPEWQWLYQRARAEWT